MLKTFGGNLAGSVPVRSISWSIIVAINLMSDARLSNKFNNTDIIMSTSDGGHTSQIMDAIIIWSIF
jgi:hypothetical protein